MRCLKIQLTLASHPDYYHSTVAMVTNARSTVTMVTNTHSGKGNQCISYNQLPDFTQ